LIDTVKIQSQSIPEDLARDLEHRLDVKSSLSGVDLYTGERSVLYEIYSGQVRDERQLHGVNLRIMRSRIVKDLDATVIGASRTKTISCKPYLWMEGSVHKAMLGHNIWGGPRELAPAVSWLVSDVSRRLGLELPEWSGWDLMRADWAETYDLGTFDHCQDYIRSLNSCRFPRREPQRYGDNSLSFPGRTTAVRIYHKGPEFAGESYRRLSRVFSREELQQLAEMSHRTLRVEVSVKRPKITEYHPLNSKIPHIATDFIRNIHDKEIKKVIREADSDLTIVRDSQAVLRRLSTVYAGRDRLVRSLFSTWVQLSALGENTVKAQMKEWSFYNHRGKLLKAGCSWTGSDVRVLDADILPDQDFVPVSSDLRCSSSEHPEVSRLLEEHRTMVA
jgi:hypothetical protein